MKNNSLIQNKKTFLLLAVLSLISISCEKVVDIDLNSSSPNIVIEGSISDQPGPYFVKLSKTVNYDETNVFPPITGANIVVSDELGNSETLLETQPGMYKISKMRGASGRTYSLTVIAEGKKYIASSTMPNSVKIDSLSVQNQFLFGQNKKVINVHFKDPAQVNNYYRFVEVKNNAEQKFIFLYDDRVQNGSFVSSGMFAEKDTLRTNDSVLVLLQCVDKGVYDYLRTLNSVSGNGGPQSTSPANPASNISNGALGYFSAYAVNSKHIIIP